jgi:RNA polymerase sigma-70 factor (ECF subfamily)
MSDPDQRLMERFQEGDVSAFEVLLHKYQAPVLALVRRYLGSRSAGIDDVAQEVFVRIFRSKHTYEPRAKVGTWIYRVTVNTCLNEIRRLGADKNRRVAGFSAVFGDDGGDAGQETLADRAAPAPDERLEAGEVEARVREAVDALPQQQRLAVVLSRYHALPYEEVAAALGSTVPAVKSLLTRARENLRRALSPYVTGAAPSSPEGGDAASDDDDSLGAPASRRGPPRRSHDDEPL